MQHTAGRQRKCKHEKQTITPVFGQVNSATKSTGKQLGHHGRHLVAYRLSTVIGFECSLDQEQETKDEKGLITADDHPQWIASNVLECGMCGDRSAVMSSPANTDRDELIRALAKQAYKHELLVKALRARGYLHAREPESLETAEDFDGFLKIFRLYFSGKRRPSESGES